MDGKLGLKIGKRQLQTEGETMRKTIKKIRTEYTK
jgi:hypothetical protein